MDSDVDFHKGRNNVNVHVNVIIPTDNESGMMSEVLNTALAAMTEKVADSGFAGSAKFQIEGEGAIVIEGETARISDDETDVTLSADADTFQSMLEGDLDPTAAFMSGRLVIDGDMGAAMQLAGVFS